MENPFNFTGQYALLGSEGKSEIFPAEAFWKMVADPNHPRNQPQLGYVITQFNFETDWDSWENHPHGDEVVLCLEGKVQFILEQFDRNHEVLLESGNYIIVPKNTWHTAKVFQPAKCLFVTWGYGTQHRPVDEG